LNYPLSILTKNYPITQLQKLPNYQVTQLPNYPITQLLNYKNYTITNLADYQFFLMRILTQSLRFNHIELDMRKIYALIIVLLTFLSSKVEAQTIINMKNGKVSACDALFFDSGGSTQPYNANESFTLTLCSDDPVRNHISLGFDFLDLAPGDIMCFYDGENTSAPLLGCASDFAASQNTIIQTNATNASGCLTIRFVSNRSNQGKGWVANVICIPACQKIVAFLDATNPTVTPKDTGWIDACPNQTKVTFKAHGEYPQNGFAYTQNDAINSFEWNFGDGTPVGKGPEVDHVFTQSGGYNVRLTITDTAGCQNINYIKQRVRISTRPTFNLGNIPSQICAGSEVKLKANVNTLNSTFQVSTKQNEGSFQSGGIRSGRLFIPDDPTQEYKTSIAFSDFGVGQTLTNVNDLLNIFVNMEHSFARDLDIKIVCPNRQQAVLHKYNALDRNRNRLRIGTPNTTNDAFFPYVNDSTRNLPGTGARYDWVPVGATFTWRSRFTAAGTYSMPPGNYRPDEALNQLVGCPLNGQWSLVVKDQFAMDNGWIFAWGLNFKKNLYPALESFTPQLTDHSWVKSDYVTTTSFAKDSMTVRPKNAGTASFSYVVKDNFGCTYDTMLSINVLPPTALACLACDLAKDFTKMRDTLLCSSSTGAVLNAEYKGNLTPSITFDAFPNQEIEFATFPVSAPYASNLPVSNILPTTITNPLSQIDSVCFDLKSLNSIDMDVKLRSPTGQTIQLFERRGGIGAPYIRNVCFSPTATQDISTAAPPFNNGFYQPEGGSATWNTLIGSTIAGNWELLVSSAQGTHKDTLSRWSITFKTQNGFKYQWSPATDLTCVTCANPRANPSVSTTYTVNITDSLGCTYTDFVRINVQDSLDAPNVTVANLNFNLIIFDWAAVNGASGYQVSVNGEPWITPSGPWSHTVVGLKTNDVVNLRVRAISSGVCGAKIGYITQATQACVATVGNGVNRIVIADSIVCYGLPSPRVNMAYANGLAPLVLKIDTISPNDGKFFVNQIYPGKHTAYVTDGAGCTDSLDFYVYQPDSLKLNITPTDIKCNGELSGKVTVLASGGVGNFVYRTTNGLLGEFRNVPVFDSLDLGNYTIEVQDGNGCSKELDATIFAPPLFEVDSLRQDVVCFGDSTGQAMAVGYGGVAPYSWQWSNGQTTETIDSLAIGTYFFTITDNNGCKINSSLTIEQPDKIETTTAVFAAQCYGEDSGQASVDAMGGSAPYTFLWSNNRVGSLVESLKAGTYIVTVNDGLGCNDTTSVVISQPDSLRFDSLIAVKATCFNQPTGRAYVVVVGGTSPYQYLWTPINQIAPSVKDLIPGKYTIIVKDANGCEKNAEIEVGAENELKIDALTSVVPIKCNGDASGEITVVPSGGTGNYTYEWNTTPIQRSATATNLTAGTYTIRLQDGNSCVAIKDTTIGQPAPINLSIASFTNIKCKGGSDGTATPSVSGGTPISSGISYSYLWSDPAAQTTAVATGLPLGTHRLTVTDANGCVASTNVNIAEPATAVTALIRQDKLGCFGDAKSEATVTALGGTGTYTYRWSNAQITQTATNLSGQKYYVTVKDANDCAALDSFDIKTLDSIAIKVTAVDPRCNDGNDGILSVDSVTGGAGSNLLTNYSYRWSTSPIQTLPVATKVSGNKLYTVIVRDIQGCENSTNVFVNNPNPIVLTPSQIDVSCFNGSDGIASVNVVGSKAPFTYQWTSNANGQTSATANNLFAGRYRVTVRDSSNCAVDTTFNILQPKGMTITNSKIVNTKCVGDALGSIEVTVTGGSPQYKLLWSNNDTTSRIKNLLAGAYNLVITDAKGCQIQETFSVTTPGGLDVDIATIPVKCFGEQTGAINIEAFGGTQPYLYSTNGVSYSGINKFLGIKAGKYDIFVKDANNCTWFEQAVVTQPTKFTIEAMPDVTINLGDSVQLFANVLNAVGNVDISWRQPYEGTLSCIKCPTPISKPLFTVIYGVYGVDSAGCRSLDSVTVNVVKPRYVFVPTGFTPNNDQVNDRLTVRGKEGTQILNFKVYDRWGELLYEVQEAKINDDSYGWDGKFRGEYMTSGMYVWYVEAQYLDGAKEIIKGSTTLIR
jgi:gliding motility-associated-like protein